MATAKLLILQAKIHTKKTTLKLFTLLGPTYQQIPLTHHQKIALCPIKVAAWAWF